MSDSIFPIKIQSVVSTLAIKQALFRGVAFAGAGLFILVLAGAFMPVGELRIWGYIIFGLGIGLIAYGLVPYRKLSQLQMRPNELCLTGENSLDYYTLGIRRIKMPIRSIEQIKYADEGILVWLKNPVPEPVIIYEKLSGLKKIRKDGQRFGPHASFFFPYFNKKSFAILAQTPLNNVMKV